MKSTKRSSHRNKSKGLKLKGDVVSYTREVFEDKLEKVADTAYVTGEFTRELSERLKRPIFFLANARSGTLLHYGIEDWKSQLSPEQRLEFTRELKESEYWKANKKRALFKTAQKWINDNKLSWFVYSTQQVKVASHRRKKKSKPIVRLPLKFEDLLEDKVTVVMGDISNKQFPGAFGKGLGWERDLPGFKEHLQKKYRDYSILMASRYHDPLGFSKFLKATQLENDIAYFFMINPLSELFIYNFINNNPILIGYLGIKYGTDHFYKEDKAYEEVPLKTTLGEMTTSRYVSLRIKEICSQKRVV